MEQEQEQETIKEKEDLENIYKSFKFINILCPNCKLRKGCHTLGQAINCGFAKINN
jgi:hypothetical protein